jgi:uncharacterized phage infection (PIP) family protein YhgE
MIEKYDQEKVGRILLQKELDLQEAKDGENIWKSLYNDAKKELNEALDVANLAKEQFDKIREEYKEIEKSKEIMMDQVNTYRTEIAELKAEASKYRNGYGILNEFFDSIPDEEKKHVHNDLEKLGL